MVSLKLFKNSLVFIPLFVGSSFGVKKITSCVNKGDFALTFDDGPSLEYTNMVLDILDKENVKATFFINGMNTCDLKNNPSAQELIKREFKSGHVVASHTYSHPLTGITQLSDEELTKEINTLNDIINDIIGVKPAFFRPPLGEYTEQNEKILEQCGITANILWNLDSEDWNVEYNATQQYIDLLQNANSSQDTFIALNHDIQKVTATENLEIVIPYIKGLGYHFVTMDVCTGMDAYQNGASNPNVKNNQNGIDNKKNNSTNTRNANHDSFILDAKSDATLSQKLNVFLFSCAIFICLFI